MAGSGVMPRARFFLLCGYWVRHCTGRQPLIGVVPLVGVVPLIGVIALLGVIAVRSPALEAPCAPRLSSRSRAAGRRGPAAGVETDGAGSLGLGDGA